MLIKWLQDSQDFWETKNTGTQNQGDTGHLLRDNKELELLEVQHYDPSTHLSMNQMVMNSWLGITVRIVNRDPGTMTSS